MDDNLNRPSLEPVTCTWWVITKFFILFLNLFFFFFNSTSATKQCNSHHHRDGSYLRQSFPQHLAALQSHGDIGQIKIEPVPTVIAVLFAVKITLTKEPEAAAAAAA